MSTKNVILGTAGHIDHGKSSLVKAMTGVDPDRLKEEKERGITIDLGFANIAYPDGLTVGIVDVPGHERLIKNMLAGAGGIDLVLMVIAADEGIMPQSREHLAICELLKIKSGLVAITKADLVDPDWLELVTDEVRQFVKDTSLQDAEIVPVSSKTGQGIDILKEKIHDVALQTRPKFLQGLFRLPIDRIFTLKGFGTVVTGTALSGTISVDAPVEILPAKISTKARGLQSHGKSVSTAYAGQRIGINVQGVEKDMLKRGDVVVTPDRFVPTKVVDATLELLHDAPSVKSKSLLHFYSGTSETIARIILYDKDEITAGETCYCQFRLKDPIVALSGDRYIIRRFSPLETIGGGALLDPHPGKRKKKMGIDDLIIVAQGTLSEKIEAKVKKAQFSGTTLQEIEGWIQGDIPELRAAVDELIKKERLIKVQDTLIHKDNFTSFRNALRAMVKKFHDENPLKPGILKEELRAKLRIDQKVFNALIPMLGDFTVEKEIIRLKEFTTSRGDEELRNKIAALLESEAFQPSLKPELAQKLGKSEKEVTDLLKLMASQGTLVRINDSLYITQKSYETMLSTLKSFYAKKPEMSVAEFRDILGTTRKYALPLLEYLDSHKITLRVGDIRKFMVK